ncbi:MAG: hypothetical protein ACI9GW_003505, partial [Halieaceae bacterium]
MASRLAKAASLLTIALVASLAWWLNYHAATIADKSRDFDAILEQAAVQPNYVATSREPCLKSNSIRNAYFGALHVHTALSGDASAWGVTATPADAYNFARGQQLSIRLCGESA